ncbi:PREDICTED: melatonin receptor type 1B-B-like [Priapulus caudatus]|uniref:Melatonin receptor type 1B-B-like n=1 Tax=Priapulus caudatus TaxID=37621 RepID=A0ABM1EUE0_PRICU|nr:PREDICTED: melatonin receptor type 1B-B-like [Priapulus caudatus]
MTVTATMTTVMTDNEHGFLKEELLTGSKILCTLTGAACLNVCNASLFTLMVISVSRMFAICYLNVYGRVFTSSKCVTIVVVTWFTVFVMNLPAYFYDNGSGFWFEPRSQSCLWNWYASPLHRHLWAALRVMTPATVTAICYLKIFIHVHKSKQRVCTSGVGLVLFLASIRL